MYGRLGVRRRRLEQAGSFDVKNSLSSGCRGPGPEYAVGAVRFLMVVLIAGGCSRQLRPIFEQPRTPITWPPAPAPARVRYVGRLESSADLKPPPKPFQSIGDFFLGAAEPELLYGPRDVVCSRDGTRVWVADPGGRCLHLFDLHSRSYVQIDRAGESRLLSPVGLCLGPEDSIFLCDAEEVAIYRLSERTGALLDGLRLTDEVQRPVALSYDEARGELFVVDARAHDVKVLDRDGRLLRIIGQRGVGQGEFNYPCDIALDGDTVWIADAGNHRVQALGRFGEPLAAFGQAGDAPGDLALPKGIALDSDGHVYVVDARFENVQVFDRSGKLLLFFGAEGTGPGEFWLPAGIFIDANDRIWVCDAYNRRVQVFDYLRCLPGRAPNGGRIQRTGKP